MSWTYACPECEAMLNPSDTIVLVAQPAGAEEGRRVLIGFHPEPGNYQISIPPGVVLKRGSRWKFFCPVCHASLVLKENENLAALKMISGSEASQVVFSCIAGEQATYVLLPHKGVQARFGDAAEIYLHNLINKKYIM
ncbi:MAG: hypothetical protein JXR96_23485 [Deltaproteobacteria bacterium]|nr:hypothetical protein [Deltaproteobacteria bacterium]